MDMRVLTGVLVHDTSVYIHTCIERERDIYIYIYIYSSTYTYTSSDAYVQTYVLIHVYI